MIPSQQRLGIVLTLGMVLTLPLSAPALEYSYQWALPSPQGNALHGLAFETSQIGYAVGTKGATIRTTDGGATWHLRSTFDSFDKNLTDVIVLSPGTILAVGDPPGIFRSTNAGATWTAVANPSTEILEDVEVGAGSTLFAIGAQGQVVRSTDGGNSWSLRTTPAPRTLHEQHWLSATDGIVVGEQLARRTTDGGGTWNLLPGVNETEDFFSEVLQVVPGILFAFADFHYAKTTNGGASWDWVFNPVFPVYRGKAVAFDASHLMLVTDLEGAEVWESTDGGDSWDPLLQRFDLGGFLEFRRLADGSLFVCSTEGDVIKSTDNGSSWINSTHSPGDEPRVVIADIEVLPGGRTFAGSTSSVGDSRWHQSEDGGLTWFEALANPGIINISDVEFWDDDRGVASGNIDSVSRTTDGGISWTSSSLPNAISNGVRAYQFALPAPGVAFCATDGVNGCLVFRTTNFGATWQQRSSGIPQSTGWLGSVSFLDASIGFAAGGNQNQSRIWKTTDGGGIWTLINTTGVPNFLSDTHWFDSANGLCAVQAASPGIYRTTNGGGIWNQVFNEAVMRFSFHEQIGYARPSAFTPGHIYETEDGGATWSVLELPSDRGGSSVTALSDGFLAGGFQSQIVRATIETATDAPEVNAPPLREDSVGWIRAMPSIGREIGIAWGLHASASAPTSFAIELIDVAGRRVRTIAQGVLSPGDSRSARWDGETDGRRKAAPGIYFARLAAGDRAQAVRIQFIR